MTASLTPMEALRRLIEACKMINSTECEDIGVWNQLQGELGVAEGVVRDFPQSDIIIAQRLRDAAEDPMWDGHAEVSKRLLILAAENMEVARARIVELEVAAVAAQPSEAAQEDAESGIDVEVLHFLLDKVRGAHSAAINVAYCPSSEPFKQAQKAFTSALETLRNTLSMLSAPTAAVSAAPSGEVERDAMFKLSNFVADNWSMKKYTLVEIEDGLRASIAAITAP